MSPLGYLQRQLMCMRCHLWFLPLSKVARGHRAIKPKREDQDVRISEEEEFLSLCIWLVKLFIYHIKLSKHQHYITKELIHTQIISKQIDRQLSSVPVLPHHSSIKDFSLHLPVSSQKCTWILLSSELFLTYTIYLKEGKLNWWVGCSLKIWEQNFIAHLLIDTWTLRLQKFPILAIWMNLNKSQTTLFQFFMTF